MKTVQSKVEMMNMVQSNNLNIMFHLSNKTQNMMAAQINSKNTTSIKTIKNNKIKPTSNFKTIK